MKVSQRFLPKVRDISFICRKQYIPIFLFVFLLSVSGCGEKDDGISERLSGPGANSALPIRVDATVTPTPAEESQAEQGSQTEDSDEVTTDEQNTTTPTPAEPEVTPTSTVSDEKSPQEVEPEKEDESPTPTPLPTPSPQESVTSSQTQSQSEKPVSEKTPSKEATATPTPVPQKTPTPAPKTAQQKTIGKEPLAKSDQQTDTQTSSKSKVPEELPIVTPHGVTLNKIVVCSNVSNRNPKKIADKFSLSKVKKVYTWMRVSGVKPPRILKHIYYWEGKFVAEVKLKIKYSSMRTWSQKTLKPLESLGKWKVIITTENENEVLAVKEFTVVP